MKRKYIYFDIIYFPNSMYIKYKLQYKTYLCQQNKTATYLQFETLQLRKMK